MGEKKEKKKEDGRDRVRIYHKEGWRKKEEKKKKGI